MAILYIINLKIIFDEQNGDESLTRIYNGFYIAFVDNDD